MIDVFEPGIGFYVDYLVNDKPFSLARYGDGEWSVIVQNRGKCVGQSLNLPGLRLATIRSIKKAHQDPRYIMACHPKQSQGNIEEWLVQHQPPWLRWKDTRTFYYASFYGKLFPFVDAIRKLNVPRVVVGPPHLRQLHSKVFKVDQFIEIPPVDAWRSKDRILDECKKVKGKVMFSISAGPTSSPLVWELFQEKPESFIMDLGSLWDVYVGKPSRSYHAKMSKEIKRCNLQG